MSHRKWRYGDHDVNARCREHVRYLPISFPSLTLLRRMTTKKVTLNMMVYFGNVYGVGIMVFGFLASFITMWYSRHREFHADAGAAHLVR
ncbi:hypothetical protein O9992_15855 [Vibrio lentus]|nr:hypothetical protein [Vibrio lentus]